MVRAKAQGMQRDSTLPLRALQLTAGELFWTGLHPPSLAHTNRTHGLPRPIVAYVSIWQQVLHCCNIPAMQLRLHSSRGDIPASVTKRPQCCAQSTVLPDRHSDISATVLHIGD